MSAAIKSLKEVSSKKAFADNHIEKDKFLIWGINTNYRKWAIKFEHYLMSKYSLSADFISTGQLRVYTDPIFPDEGFTAANDPGWGRRAVYQKQCERVYVNNEKMQRDKMAMWSEIWMHMSELSQDKVLERPACADAKADDRNVSDLWKLVALVHSGAATGIPVQDRKAQKTKIIDMKQYNNESLIEFKKRIVEAYSVYRNLGGPLADKEEIIQDFLVKLDQVRYGSFYDDLSAGVALGQCAYPDTIEAAVELANNFVSSAKVAGQLRGKARIETAFVVKTTQQKKIKNDEVKQAEIIAVVNKEKVKKDISKVTCFKCRKLGHFANRCPNQKRINDSDSVCCYFDKGNIFYQSIFQKLSNSHVLLDSCASVSLFNNASLLTNVRPTKVAVNIIGVNSEPLSVKIYNISVQSCTVQRRSQIFCLYLNVKITKA